MSSRLDVNRVFSGGSTEHTLQEVVAGINHTTATLQNNDVTTHTKLDEINETSQITNDNLEKIINKEGDIQSNISYSEGAQVWADTVPIPTTNPIDPIGWLYTNTNAGNAMNLYYFNGLSETKTLSQVVGQYAVITNLSTKLNNSLVFAIYTKGLPNYTSRITHSAVNGVDMVPGGKYLVYWGNVSNDIYPNLPRLNFTTVITTGSALPTEEILSVTLNTDSSTPAGDVKISIESIGVVFSNQSRIYNLLGSPTEYETLVNIKKQVDKNTYDASGNLKIVGNVDVNVISGFNLETTQSAIKTQLEKNTYDTSGNLKIVGDVGVNVISGFNLETTQTAIKTQLEKNTYDTSGNLKIVGDVGVNVISGFNLETTQTAIKTQLEKNTYDTSGNLKIVGDVDVNVISGFNLETTQTAIKTQLEKNTYDTSGNLKIVGDVDVNVISGFNLETTQTAIKTQLEKNTYDTSGNLKIVGDVAVNTISGFATETTLSTIEDQISKLTFSTNEDSLIISGNVGVAGSVDIANWNEANIAVDISGQYVNIGNWDDANISVDISGSTVIAKVQGYDGSGYNNLFVDTDGFITANTLTAVHDNILLGFDTFYADYCAGSTNVGIWSKDNPYALTQDGWYCTTLANTNDVSIYTYLNHYFGIYNQSDFTYNDIDTWYSIIQNWNCVNLTTMPTVRVYSSTSRWDFTIASGTTINNGEQVMLYFGLLSRVKTNEVECRRLQYTLTGGTGTRAGTENITKIELFIPQSINQYVDMNVIEGAVYVKNKGFINYYFTNDKVGREQNDIRSIKTNSDKFIFTANRLLCDVSGQEVAGKTLWLTTDTQHISNPGAFGDPNLIKSADGAMSTYLNGATGYYNITTGGKLNSGNMAPINTVQTEYNSTTDSYRQSLCVRDPELYNAMTGSGIVIGGKDSTNGFRTLRLTANGNVDISGQSVLANAFSRTDSANRTLTAVQPTGTSTTNIRALETYAYNVCLNNSSNLNLPVTSTTTDTTQSMDVVVNNGSTTVVNYGQTDVSGRTGLNIYQIYPKKIHYSMGGRTESSSASVLLGGTGSSAFIYGFTFGKASAQPFSAVLTAGTVPKLIRYEYVDASGNLRLDGSANITALNTVVTLQPTNMISVNKHWMAGSVGTADQLVIRVGTVNAAGSTICHSDVDDYNNGVVTVPNGYIGYLTNISMFTPSQCFLAVVKWDVDSYRSVSYPFYNTSNQNIVAGFNGSLGGIYTAGESIAFSRITPMGASICNGMFTLEPI
jgi:hypothetical protein